MNIMFSGIIVRRKTSVPVQDTQSTVGLATHTNETQASNAHKLGRDSEETGSGWRLHPGVSRLDSPPF